MSQPPWPGRMLAVDPGEVHCGWAEFSNDKCTHAGEWSPPEMYQYIVDYSHRYGELVVEEFRLYPWKSEAQGFSQLRTVEVIGVLRYLASQHELPMIEQSARIKKPTFARFDAMGYEWVSRGHGGHAKDAEAHGLYRTHKGRGG